MRSGVAVAVDTRNGSRGECLRNRRGARGEKVGGRLCQGSSGLLLDHGELGAVAARGGRCQAPRSMHVHYTSDIIHCASRRSFPIAPAHYAPNTLADGCLTLACCKSYVVRSTLPAYRPALTFHQLAAASAGAHHGNLPISPFEDILRCLEVASTSIN